jgi:hypothetical protein
LTPASLHESEQRAQEHANAIAASPIARAAGAALMPGAAPLEAAEYAVGGRLLGAAEKIPGVNRLLGTGLRRVATEGAALGAGFQAGNEAKQAVQGQPNPPGQAVANVVAGGILGGTLGAAGGKVAEYADRLRLRRRLTRPLEEPEPGRPPAPAASEAPPTPSTPGAPSRASLRRQTSNQSSPHQLSEVPPKQRPSRRRSKLRSLHLSPRPSSRRPRTICVNSNGFPVLMFRTYRSGKSALRPKSSSTKSAMGRKALDSH